MGSIALTYSRTDEVQSAVGKRHPFVVRVMPPEGISDYLPTIRSQERIAGLDMVSPLLTAPGRKLPAIHDRSRPISAFRQRPGRRHSSGCFASQPEHVSKRAGSDIGYCGHLTCHHRKTE